ncbi:MAG: hypothetical protein GY774_04880 [Planctomycetes bacterium]|nr:hypothetical protein [Planctomycetota bacterium]
MEYIPKTNTVKSCITAMKKLRALPPYDNPGNLVAHDGVYASHIDRTYSKRVRALAENRLTKGE